MNTRSSVIFALIAICGLFGFLMFLGVRGDGIPAGKIYGLGYTYKATVKGVPSRVFDFKDRNLPEKSIIVPLRDDRGLALVRENTSLPPSTVRKVVGRVRTRVVEGVTYPGYDYTLWEYHMRVSRRQSVVPEMTPRK